MSADRWARVPVDATQSMTEAGSESINANGGHARWADIREAWADMLAAAPAAPAAEPVGWISVEKQMPPPGSRCLVWFDGDCIGIAHTFTKWRHHSHPLGYLIQGHGGSHDSVTHWMPLPAAPGAAPAQSREPLTADPDKPHAVNVPGYGWVDVRAVRAIERAHGIGSQP